MQISVHSDAIARAYDEMPYESRPFPQSHPAKSAAIARLFGLTPPDLTTARILELGCAAGGNLIPLAAAYPDATCVGFDLSAVQVAEGQQRITALGLHNVTLRQRSIADVSPADGSFDFIICHGVYSWVPASVRAAILRVARENLSPNGVVYISYNVFPGWRLRTALRDAMLFHAEGLSDRAQQVHACRAFLKSLADATDANGPYGQVMRREAAMMASYQDYYIAHEFLELYNEPCYVRDFIKAARDNGLEFLAEANLFGTIAETFGESAGKLLRELSGNQLDRLEQYADFLTGRTFRQSLLVRSEQCQSLDRTLTPARLEGLHVSLPPLSPPEMTGETHVLRDLPGRSLSTTDVRVRDCLAALAQRYPETSTAKALAHKACPGDAQFAQVLQDALFKMVLIGMAEITMAPVETRVASPEAPTALPLARLDASCRRTWTTNVRHEAVPLDVMQLAVLPLLDGTNDIQALHRSVETYVSQGSIRFESNGVALAGHDIEVAIKEHVTNTIARLAKSGLLVSA